MPGMLYTKNELKNPNVVVIIQARMTSTRLPGKILLPLNHKTVLEHVISQCRLARLVNKIVVAVPAAQESQAIAHLISQWKDIGYFEGDELNVLDRYYGAAKKFSADIIVRITSDCPLVDPTILDVLINHFLTLNELEGKQLDYYSNGMERTFPRGIDMEIFTMEALAKAHTEATVDADKEHVTRYFYMHPDKFRLSHCKLPCDLAHYRLTLDTSEDYAMFTELFKYIRHNEDFYLCNIIRILRKYPHISEINGKIKQKEV